IYLQKNELLKAREFFEKSLDIQRKIGDLIGIGKCYYSLSLLSLKEELLDESFRYLREAKSIFDDHGFLEGKLLVTMLEGLINLRQKRITKAESAFSKCKKLISEKYRAKPVKSNMADKKMNVQILINLGNLFLWDSNINLPEIGKTLNVKAYDYYNQAADLAREINDRNGECHATFQMGIILHERGGLDNIRSSNEKFTNALEIAKMINDDELILRCLLFLGVNHRLLKKYEDSITYLQDCLVLAKAREYPIFTIKALLEMFQVFFEIGRSDDALSALKEAENLAGNNAELKRCLGEIYYLYGSFYETMGDIGKANDFFLQSLKLSEKGKDIKSISKTFYQLAKLNENQGFITSALEYIDKIINIYSQSNQILELSRAKIERARLLYLKNDLDKTYAILDNEIKFLEEINVPNAELIKAKAKLLFYQITYEKGNKTGMQSQFNEIFDYFYKNDKLDQLFDMVISQANDSIEKGSISFLKPIITKFWNLLKQNKLVLENEDHLLFLIYIQGLIYLDRGKLNLAKKFFNECKNLFEKMNLQLERGIITAQLADINLLEGKTDVIEQFQVALNNLKNEGNLWDLINLHAKIGSYLYLEGNIQEAIDHIQKAIRFKEEREILKNVRIINNRNRQYIKFYTSEIPLYSFLSGLYLEKFEVDNNPTSLERAVISLELHKSWEQFYVIFDKQLAKIFPCKERENAVDLEESLKFKAEITKRKISFYQNRKRLHDRLLNSPIKKQNNVKKNLEFVIRQIKKEKQELTQIIDNLKKNRTQLMNCIDSGYYMPFLGFKLLKNIKKFTNGLKETTILDYGIYPEFGMIAIYILHGDFLSVTKIDATIEFFDLIRRLNDAIAVNDNTELLITHQELTKFLFPQEVKDALDKLKSKEIMICPDPILDNVNFNLLGDNKNLHTNYIFSYIPHLLNLKILYRKLQNDENNNDDEKNIALLFPDTEIYPFKGEYDELIQFFESQRNSKFLSDIKVQFLTSSKANYSKMVELGGENPNIIHFSGHSYFSDSLIFKSFLNLHDRNIFVENLLDIDVKNDNLLLVFSTDCEIKIGLQKILNFWRILSFIHINNLIYIPANQGYSEKFIVHLYNGLVQGMTLGNAYQVALDELAKISEAPATSKFIFFVGYPSWKLKNNFP
ncbi:MAG: CHAT domain-containing protein, partial [Promethearchaeota archaeon]